jgi:hypothetical protein
MTFPKSLLPGSRFATFVIWTIVAIACGSRTSTDFDLFEEGGTQGEGGNSSTTTSSVTTTGVTTGFGSTGSTGGSSFGGGTGVAGTGFGGFGNAGSAVVCPCAPPPSSAQCPPGTQVGMGPGPCFCPSCVTCNVGCPLIGCPSGSHLETQPGQCCGRCVADAKSCAQGINEYEMSRQQLLDKYGSLYCKVDAECTVAPEINQCVARCGVPLAASAVSNWVGITSSLAATSCANCPRPFPPPCPAQAAQCIGNRCEFGTLH